VLLKQLHEGTVAVEEIKDPAITSKGLSKSEKRSPSHTSAKRKRLEEKASSSAKETASTPDEETPSTPSLQA